MGISHMENLGRFPLGKPAATETSHATQLNSFKNACWVFWCFHNPPNCDMDYRIFNVHASFSCVCVHTGVGHTTTTDSE